MWLRGRSTRLVIGAVIVGLLGVARVAVLAADKLSVYPKAPKGGLLVGACMTQRPDFSGVACRPAA